eukprot:NODE_9904_length_324_cov_213.159851.p2 GENE.NODE_9904_length_324_cov_213.159851~~NODE_9904_length_324_cov_213.159851.p2  ORF type:complete len:72 (-),score=15.03 NODE_9904_length_324_cov_213.159851:90-275(-)
MGFYNGEHVLVLDSASTNLSRARAGEVICYSLRNDLWKVRLHANGEILAVRADALRRATGV